MKGLRMHIKSFLLLLTLPTTLASPEPGVNNQKQDSKPAITLNDENAENSASSASISISEPKDTLTTYEERNLRMSGCELCARTGRCDYAFKDGPGHFCRYVLDFFSDKPCCCPNNYQCDATAYECLCFHPDNDNGRHGGDYYDYHDYRGTDEAGASVFGVFFLVCLCWCCCAACWAEEHTTNANANVGVTEPFIPIAVPAYDSMDDGNQRPPPTAPHATRAPASSGGGGGGGSGIGSGIAAGVGGFLLGEMLGQAIGGSNERRHHHHHHHRRHDRGGWWGNDGGGGWWRSERGGGFWGGGGGTTIRGDTGGGGHHNRHHRHHRHHGGTTIRGDS